MKDLANWLVGMESMAGNLYAEAALRFPDDPEFSAFLQELSEEEAWHFHLVGSAAQCLESSEEELPVVISLSDEQRKAVSEPLLRLYDKLATGTVTKNEMLEGIVAAEFAEWNDFFEYVVNAMKERNRQFMQVASRILQHRRGIESFLENQPDCEELVEQVRGLPKVWERRILVVEDASLVAHLLEAICRKYGVVEVAWDGKEGLDKVRQNYYDVIISDIEMPVMNGIDFFKQALQGDPLINNRFLFFTGRVTAERAEYFDEQDVRYLQKPADMHAIQTAVEQILECSLELAGVSSEAASYGSL